MRRRRGATTFLIVALTLLTLAPAAFAATVTAGGAWCWFADPRAIEWQGRTVFGWVAPDGRVMVGDLGGTRVALGQLPPDDHNNPALYIRKDGRLMAFWSMHGGPEIYYRTANSLTDWGPTRTAPANPPGGLDQHTYPNPVRVDGTLYLFWSGTNGTATYATSPDDGDTWSDARHLFDPGASHFVRYIKYRQAGDEIHMAWSLSHPRLATSGIYHAVIRDGKIYRQDGTEIGELGVPLAPTAGDLVYDPATEGGAWIHDIAVIDGAPVIAYAAFPGIDRHVYRYARWDDGWLDERLAEAGPAFASWPEVNYSGGVTIDPAAPSVLYLSRKVAGQFEIERWARGPAGWTHEPVTHNSPVLNVRPYPVAGGVGWMRGEYPSYTQFKTGIVWLPAGERYPNPPAPPPSTSAPAGSVPAVRTQPKARPCQGALRKLRRKRTARSLRRYWRCRAKHGDCRRVLVKWRRSRKRVVLAVYRAHCRRGSRQAKPAGSRQAKPAWGA